MQPLILYGQATGPNPWKTAVILEELGLDYETVNLPFPQLKGEEFLRTNPNGRVPALEDKNEGLVIWESGAINAYLVDKYDTENKLAIRSGNDSYLVMQWLMFQMSGQGPYFGQAMWFKFFHSERLESATKRYINEVRRVISVLDRALQGKTYLVGEKCTMADLAFVTWEFLLPMMMKGENMDLATEFPNWWAWHTRLAERPSVMKVAAEREKAIAANPIPVKKASV